MARSKGKQPKIKESTNGGKTPKMDESIKSFFSEYPTWSFKEFDWNHKKWSDIDNHGTIKELLKKLADFEGMVWSQIFNQKGRRRKGTNNHYISFNDMSKEARQRAIDIKIDIKCDELFSIGFDNKCRIFGILTSSCYRLIWYDSDHEVCPAKKRNT